jgi:hypothetical protein
VQRGETVILIASQALPNAELHASGFDRQMRWPCHMAGVCGGQAWNKHAISSNHPMAAHRN